MLLESGVAFFLPLPTVIPYVLAFTLVSGKTAASAHVHALSICFVVWLRVVLLLVLLLVVLRSYPSSLICLLQ